MWNGRAILVCKAVAPVICAVASVTLRPFPPFITAVIHKRETGFFTEYTYGVTTMSNELAGRDARGRFAPGNAGGPGGARTSTKEQQQEYIDAMYEIIPLDRFRRMVDKVATHVEETGSIKAFEAIANRMFGKPATVAPNAAGNNLDGLLAVLAEVREQRRQWEQQERAESGTVAIIDVTPKVTQ